MTVRILAIDTLAQAEKAILSIGAEPSAVQFMAPKAVSRVIKLQRVRPPAANIIKQEMLSFGGEAATAYGAINNSVESTDLLIFGTLKQINLLVEKLKLHQFGLPQLAAEIKTSLENYEAKPRAMRFRSQNFDFGQRTYLMGILNVTPDSFSDGGQYLTADQAVAQAKQLVADGADIIDVGGESTRPGAAEVSVDEEKRRVLPVIERLARETDTIISIDSTKAEVVAAALAAGASMVNDISGFRADPRLVKIVAEAGCPICLMHRRGTPKEMQINPVYHDLMNEIIEYLSEGLEIAKKSGILPEQIIVDPGIGFGKSLEHNLEIMKRLKELKVLGCPVLVGTSRKSFIGKVLDLPVDDRSEGTAATVALAIAGGADFIRVHDIKAMARVARMTDTILRRS